VQDAKFLSVTSDGSTDSSRTKQEIIFLRYVENGHIHTEFAGIVSPKSPDAVGLFEAILKGLAGVNVTEETLKKN
jgi:hypothetical protein